MRGPLFALCSDAAGSAHDLLGACRMNLGRQLMQRKAPSRCRGSRLLLSKSFSRCSRSLSAPILLPSSRDRVRPATRRPLRADGWRSAAALLLPRASRRRVRHSRSTSLPNWLTSWLTPSSRIFDSSQSSRMTLGAPNPTHPRHEPALDAPEAPRRMRSPNAPGRRIPR